jgi:hypothetical protein
VLSFDGIRTLADVVIVDPIKGGLVLLVALFREVVATMVVQTKKNFININTCCKLVSPSCH